MTTAALAPTDLQFLAIPVASLHPSPLNPRKRMTGIEELADSIRSVGILEPLVVRPVPYGVYEVVAGGRRLEAARLAELDTVPCTVRPLTDEQALELAIIENNQRGDIHPLEEADAFQRLRDLDPGHTPGSIAAKIGRPVAYVVQRLKLLALVPEVREAFANDDITIGHAHLLAALTPEQQAACLGACFEYVLDFSGGDEDGESQRATAPVKRLREHIRETVALDVASPDVQAEFPQLAEATAAAAAEGATVLMLADTWGERPKDANAPLPRSCFREVDQDDEGARLGVFVVGRRQGRTAWVSVIPERAPQPKRQAVKKTDEERAAEKAQEERQRREREEMQAKMARRVKVETAGALELIGKVETSGLTEAAQLRVLAEVLVGGDCFDEPTLDAVATSLKVPPTVFRYSGTKDRLKLPPLKLTQVVAVLVVGAQAAYDAHGSRVADAFDAFGVDLKAIDKAIAKEQAAPAKKAARKKAR